MRSPALADGYLNRPDLEGAAFHEGWYRSGDRGHLDAAGRLHILGRAVDIVLVEGRALTPTMLEDALCAVPSVRYAVAVVDGSTESWRAAVEAWPGATVDIADCVQAVTTAFGRVAASRLQIVPVPRVPRTEQGKPDRAAIRSLRSQVDADG